MANVQLHFQFKGIANASWQKIAHAVELLASRESILPFRSINQLLSLQSDLPSFTLVIMSAPFRLLDLPRELLDNILDLYHEDTHIAIWPKGRDKVYDLFRRKPRSIAVTGHASLALERVSRKLHSGSRAARDRKKSHNILLRNDACAARALPDFFRIIVTAPHCQWLRDHTTNLTFLHDALDFCKQRIDWITFLSYFPRLQRIMISVKHYGIMNWVEIEQVAKNIKESTKVKKSNESLLFGENKLTLDITSAMETMHPGQNRVSCELDHLWGIEGEGCGSFSPSVRTVRKIQMPLESSH